MKTFENIQALSTAIISELANIKCRSKWDKGVNKYAEELAEGLTKWESVPQDTAELRAMLLNGAADWSAYSFGGSSLIYNGDIAERLATPSEIKYYKQGGMREPNARETWLDVQTRALIQASQRVVKVFANL